MCSIYRYFDEGVGDSSSRGNAYKAIVSILVILSLVLIVVGWRNTVPVYLYELPAGAKRPALFLLVVACILSSAARFKNRCNKNFSLLPVNERHCLSGSAFTAER